MDNTKLLGAIVLGIGILSLAYGGFSYSKERSEMNMGPLSIHVQDRQRVDLPMWLGVGLIVVGGGLLAVGGKKV
jgi:uncharacterized membrane protein YidH (DUF202 family)